MDRLKLALVMYLALETSSELLVTTCHTLMWELITFWIVVLNHLLMLILWVESVDQIRPTPVLGHLQHLLEKPVHLNPTH